jgi:hypothetical protein
MEDAKGAVAAEMKPLNSDTDPIGAIEAWLLAQCNGDWEHSYGLSIETTDNPGWYVQVDLRGTAWEDLNLIVSRIERTDSSWIQIEVRDGKFVGSGGIGCLNEILSRFMEIVKM